MYRVGRARGGLSSRELDGSYDCAEERYYTMMEQPATATPLNRDSLLQTRGGSWTKDEHVLFADGKRVEGANLLEFLRWAWESFQWTAGASPPQWRIGSASDPAQCGLGSSAGHRCLGLCLSGLAAGAFMLQRRTADEWGRGQGADARIKKLPPGWDLLDGQQRVGISAPRVVWL